MHTHPKPSKWCKRKWFSSDSGSDAHMLIMGSCGGGQRSAWAPWLVCVCSSIFNKMECTPLYQNQYYLLQILMLAPFSCFWHINFEDKMLPNVAHPLTGDDNQCYSLHNVMFDRCIFNTASYNFLPTPLIISWTLQICLVIRLDHWFIFLKCIMKLYFKHSQKMLLTHCCSRSFQQIKYIHIYKSIFQFL